MVNRFQTLLSTCQFNLRHYSAGTDVCGGTVCKTFTLASELEGASGMVGPGRKWV
jgi:hypothetical protein